MQTHPFMSDLAMQNEGIHPAWIKSPSNPVPRADSVEGGVLAGDPAVLHENGQYLMWY
jgi:hypothetical protein